MICSSTKRGNIRLGIQMNSDTDNQHSNYRLLGMNMLVLGYSSNRDLNEIRDMRKIN